MWSNLFFLYWRLYKNWIKSRKRLNSLAKFVAWIETAVALYPQALHRWLRNWRTWNTVIWKCLSRNYETRHTSFIDYFYFRCCSPLGLSRSLLSHQPSQYGWGFYVIVGIFMVLGILLPSKWNFCLLPNPPQLEGYINEVPYETASCQRLSFSSLRPSTRFSCFFGCWLVVRVSRSEGDFRGMWKLTLLTSLLQPLPLILVRWGTRRDRCACTLSLKALVWTQALLER